MDGNLITCLKIWPFVRSREILSVGDPDLLWEKRLIVTSGTKNTARAERMWAFLQAVCDEVKREIWCSDASCEKIAPR